MTSIMQRNSPKLSQQQQQQQQQSIIEEHEYNRDQAQHQPRSQSYTTSRDPFHHLTSSPDIATLGISTGEGLGEQLAHLQRELMANSSLGTSNSDQSTHFDPRSNVTEEYQNDHYKLEGGEDNSGSHDDPAGANFEVTTTVGLFEDPDVLALIGEGQATLTNDSNNLDVNCGLNTTQQALSSHSTDNGLLQPQSNFDSASSTSPFEFPMLPPSLLDQAPEYEYSLHTQINVFDAVQTYQQGGDEQFYALNNYDPAILAISPNDNVINEGYWNYHDASGGGTLTQMAIAPELTSIQGSSSLGDYPEPSTAPTSRGSDWKQDQITNALQASFVPSQDYPLKRRRESFDGRFEATPLASNIDMFTAYGHPLQHPNSQQMQQHGHHGVYMISHQAQQDMSQRDPRDPYMMASHAFNGPNRGSRVISWEGEGNIQQEQQISQDWPPPPAPAPAPGYNGMMQTVQRHNASMASNPFHPQSHPNTHQQQQHQQQQHHHSGMMQSASVFAPPRMSSAAHSANDAMAARLGAMPNNLRDHKTTSHSRNAQDQMIDALGNAMDMSMETEGVAKCPYPNCSKTFAKNRSYNLKAHLRSHSQLKPFACNHCPRAFSRKHDLERHARVHSGDKPYICEACGKGFPRSDALRRHWRVEKECGEKAVEIEAGQAAPAQSQNSSNPSVISQGKGNASTITANPNSNAPMMTTHQQQYQLQNNNTQQQQQHQEQQEPKYWESQVNTNTTFIDSYNFQQPDRKRSRVEYH